MAVIPCIVFFDAAPAQDQHHPFAWIMVLLVAIAASILSTVAHNFIIDGGNKRCHNMPLLVNECLAEHHSAYILYFITLAASTGFSEYWGSQLAQLSLVLAIIFYLIGLFTTTRHDTKIKADHACANPSCSARLKWQTTLSLCGVNILLACVMLGLSIYLAVLTVLNPGR